MVHWSVHLALRRLACCLLLALSVAVRAEGIADPETDGDAAALMLADQAPGAVPISSHWQRYVEAAAGTAMARSEASQGVQRLSLDIRYDGAPAPGWRWLMADRLDANAPSQMPDDNGINTLKEAYLSHQVDAGRLLDMGRINQRNGMALAYNPTDFFKTGAVRSAVSVDPQSLKENRQGSVMVRAQQIWQGGSVTALYSPLLARQPDSGAYAWDLGATNNHDRSLLVFSPQWSQTISPQFQWFQQDQAAPQIGVNLAALLNDATVLYAEWSGGQSLSQRSQALAAQGIAHADDSAFYSRWAAGLRYTSDNKISFSAEFEYNGAALNAADWEQLGNGNPALYSAYRSWVQAQQEVPTQQATFFQLTWQDVFVNHLDLSALQRVDLADSSSMQWLELRYRLPGDTEVALQWQRNQGRSLSDYGAMPVKENFLLVFRGYF